MTKNTFCLSDQPYSLSLALPFPPKLKLSLCFPRTILQLHPALLLSSPQLSCNQPSSSQSGWWIVHTTGLADRPFLSRQEHPPPKRPPTCWCPLEARASPAPPVRPNQGPDRGSQPVKSHLSAVHTGLETPYTPAVPLFSPHPTLPLFYTECQWLLFGEKKRKERKRGIQRNKEATARWACFIGFGGPVRTAVTAGHESQLKPRLSFIPVWFLRSTLASLYQ